MPKIRANTEKPTSKRLDTSDRFATLNHMDTHIVSDEKRVLTIELPASVVEKLKTRAKKNERSLAGELRYILTNSSTEEE